MKTYLLPCVCLQDLCVNAGQAGGVLSCPACGRSVAVPKFRDMQALPESVLPLSRPQRSWTVFHALVLAGTLLAFLSGTAVFLIGSPPKAVVDAATIRIAVAAASDQKFLQPGKTYRVREWIDHPLPKNRHSCIYRSLPRGSPGHSQ